MYKKVIQGLFIALFTLSVFAAAPAFEEVDADKNRAVSHTEKLTSGLTEEAFFQADVDRNNQLDPDEFKGTDHWGL